MRNLLSLLFPWKLHMHMLQLEEYKLARFIKWIGLHPFRRKVESKKAFIVTAKVKLLFAISSLWLIYIFIAFGPITAIIIATQPFILFSLAILSIKPYEQLKLYLTVSKVRSKITQNKNLKVIAIAGSYGKTSTKELLYQLIKDEYKTLRTPESFNTPFGIAKVVDLELDASYEYFLCELGEYRENEISELSEMVQPSYGIITGITKQHFERFKSIRAITNTIFELSDFIENQENMVYNIDNKDIVNELSKRGLHPKWTYAIQNPYALVRADHITFSKEGAALTLFIGEKKYNIKTPLFGYGNIINMLGAICMALRIGVSEKHILSVLSSLSPAFNRSVTRREGKATVIDNTYSSNIVGFEETIRTAKAIHGTKILITPGIVELGSEEKKTHQQLGKDSFGVFDKIILVGKNSRTQAFFEGSEENKKITFIRDSRADYRKALSEATEKYQWVFLENDVTQNY